LQSVVLYGVGAGTVVQYIIGFLSVGILATSIWQMLWAFGERANAHHTTAKYYASIERKIGEFITFEKFQQPWIEEVRRELDSGALSVKFGRAKAHCDHVVSQNYDEVVDSIERC